MLELDDEARDARRRASPWNASSSATIRPRADARAVCADRRDAGERGRDLDAEVAHAERLDDVAERAALERLRARPKSVSPTASTAPVCGQLRRSSVEQRHARRSGQRDVDEHEVVRLSLQRARRLADVVRGVADARSTRAHRAATKQTCSSSSTISTRGRLMTTPCSIESGCGSRSNASVSARVELGVRERLAQLLRVAGRRRPRAASPTCSPT